MKARLQYRAMSTDECAAACALRDLAYPAAVTVGATVTKATASPLPRPAKVFALDISAEAHSPRPMISLRQAMLLAQLSAAFLPRRAEVES